LNKRGQGAFEYVLLLGGVLLIVVLAVVLLRGGLFSSASQNVNLNACKNTLTTASGCFNSQGEWLTDAQVSVTNSCHDTLETAGYTCAGVLDSYTCQCGPNPATG